MASKAATPPVSLKERIAALQQQRTGATSPTPVGQGSTGGRASPGAGTTTGQAPGSLRDRISKFEQKGGTPVPRGSFGMGAPAPAPTDAGVRRRGELYGNRLGLAHHNNIPQSGRSTSLHPSRRGSGGEGDDRSGGSRRAASDYVGGSRPLSPDEDYSAYGGSAYGDSRAPSPGIEGSRPASPALHEAQAKLDALESIDAQLAPASSTAAGDEASSSPPSDAQVALAGVLSGTGSPPPSEPKEIAQAPVPATEPVASPAAPSTPSQTDVPKADISASPSPKLDGAPAPWMQKEDLRSDAPSRPSVDTVRPSKLETHIIIPPSISISAASTPNTAVPHVPATPIYITEPKEDASSHTSSPLAIPGSDTGVDKRMSVDTAEILTGSPVTISSAATKPMFFTASQSPKTHSPPSGTTSPVSSADSQPATPSSATSTPPPTSSSRSFSAVVHRRTTLRKAQTERPSTMYENAEYIDQGIADRPKVPVQKVSEADLSDLGALLANAALLEQKLESGPIASPKKKTFETSVPSIGQTMNMQKSEVGLAPIRSDQSHGRNDSQMTLRPSRPDTPPAIEREPPTPSFGEFGEFKADLALPAADAIGRESMAPPPVPPKETRTLKGGSSALRRLSTVLMPERYSMSSSDDSASVATPPNSDFDSRLISPPRTSHGGRDDAASFVSGRSVNSRWSFKGSTKSLSRASTVASKFFSIGRRPSVSSMAGSSIEEQKPPRLPSPVPSIRPLDLPPSLDTQSQSLTPPAHGQYASRRDTWMSTTSAIGSSASGPQA